MNLLSLCITSKSIKLGLSEKVEVIIALCFYAEYWEVRISSALEIIFSWYPEKNIITAMRVFAVLLNGLDIITISAILCC